MTGSRHSLRRRWVLAALLVQLVAALPASAAVEVKLRLPMRARIDLTGKRTIVPAPFIVVTREGAGETPGASSLNVQREFERYIVKVLRRETSLKVLECGPVDYPSYDLDVLTRNAEF